MTPKEKPVQEERPAQEKEKLTVYVPADLAERLKIAAIKQRRTISAVVEKMIRDGLDAGGEK